MEGAWQVKLTGQQIHAIIAERKEKEALVRAELRAGTLQEPPPLFLTHISQIAPPLPLRKLSETEQKRLRSDTIRSLERALKNPNLIPTERKRLKGQLEEMRK